MLKRSKIIPKIFLIFANFALGLSYFDLWWKIFSTLPCLPILRRSKISPKIFPTLPTLPRVWVISIYEKNYFSTLPTLPELKEAKLVQKYPQLCQGLEIFQFIRKIISQLCQLCQNLKEAKLVQKYSQLCQLCLVSDICPFWENLYLNFANFALNKRFISELCQLCFAYYVYLEIDRNMHQLCQLCFFITSFENMSTLPNFAQLCTTMHFSHSQTGRLLEFELQLFVTIWKF